MGLLFAAPDRDQQHWKEALLQEDPNLDLHFWPDIERKESINFIVCWNHPTHFLTKFPNLQVVASLGAGVDHILSDPQLPEDVTVCRTLTPRLKQEMVDYIRTALLMHQRHIPTYWQQQQENTWKSHENLISEQLTIGVMGLGQIGMEATKQLVQSGYQVRGWSRTEKSIAAVNTFAGKEQKTDFIRGLDVVICLLPLTQQTHGILNLDLFKQIDNNALVINLARGEHLIDEDLVYALERGLLQWAILDVFDEEPLPDDHAFWNRRDVLITPHIGGITPADEAASVIVDNYKRAMSGMDLKYTVDPEKGY